MNTPLITKERLTYLLSKELDRGWGTNLTDYEDGELGDLQDKLRELGHSTSLHKYLECLNS